MAERKDNFFTDVVCGRGDCAGMTYVITSTGLICQFDEHRQMRAERDLQVFLHYYDLQFDSNVLIEMFFFSIEGKNQLFSYW